MEDEGIQIVNDGPIEPVCLDVPLRGRLNPTGAYFNAIVLLPHPFAILSLSLFLFMNPLLSHRISSSGLEFDLDFDLDWEARENPMVFLPLLPDLLAAAAQEPYRLSTGMRVDPRPDVPTSNAECYRY